MFLKKINIAGLVALFIGIICAQTFAQSGISNYVTESWVNSNHSDLTKEQILLSIKSLKKAEAGISDSSTAGKLAKIGYLSIVKSGFTSSKIDNYKRSGWWMLSYPIAVKYGLKINGIIDERRDLDKSINAAFTYWMDLKTTYGNDEKADLIFLESAIAVTKYFTDSINHPKEYGKIRNTELRLREIKRLYNSHSLEKFVGPFQPISKVHSNLSISFESIHHFLQIPTTQLEKLNPQWVSNVYNPYYGELLLPARYKDEFDRQLQSMEQKTRDDQIIFIASNVKRKKQLIGDIPDLKAYKPIRYKVKMGDNLGKIAQRYHVKISSIRAWNELKSDRIYAGQRITIYIPIHRKEIIVKTSPKKIRKRSLKAGEYQEYIVKTGDTLWGISQQFEDISADIIMEDNGIDENISPGQVLKIRIVE